MDLLELLELLGQDLHSIGNTGEVLFFDGTNITGSTLFTFDPNGFTGPLGQGKVTISGIIDPVGLQLTPINMNPLSGITGILWVNNIDGLLYLDDSPVGIPGAAEGLLALQVQQD